MDFKALLKKLTPYLSAAIIFLIIGFIYFQPVLDGKVLRKGDSLNAWGGKKEIVDFRKDTGKEALWTNSMFGGMPAFQINVKYKVKDMYFFKQIMELYTPDPVRFLLLYLIGFYILLLTLKVNPWLAIAGAIAYALSTYFIIIIGAGHLWKVNALAFIPPALAGILLVFRGKYLWGGLLATLFLIFELYSNHIQMTYYFLMLVICITVFEFHYRWKQKQLKQFFKAITVLAAAALIAIAANGSNLYSSYQYSKSTIRGKSELTLGSQHNKTGGIDRDYATQWSYGLQETLSLLIPNIKGGAGSPSEAVQIIKYINGKQIKDVNAYYNIKQVDNRHYWGNQPFTVGPVYAGAILMFLFALGLVIIKGRLKWGLLSASILAVMLSWGHNFPWLTNFFFDYIPLYDKFRAVSSILIIVELCVPLLAILAVKKIIEEPEILLRKVKVFSVKMNILILPFLFTGGIASILYLFPNLFLDFLSKIEINYFAQLKSNNSGAFNFIQQIESDLINARIAVFRADALRSIIFIVLTVTLLYSFSRKFIKTGILIAALIILILADLWPVNKRFTSNDNFVAKKELKLAFNPTQADYNILQLELQNNPQLKVKMDKAIKVYKQENHRVSKMEEVAVQLWTLNKNTDYRVFNTTVGTFQNASTSYYHKSIGGFHGAKLRRIQELYDYHIEKGNKKVLNMLNAKYSIVRGDNGQPTVVQNPDALGQAWLVSKYKLVKNANQEILSLNSFNPKTELIVDKRFANHLDKFVGGTDSLANIYMTSYSPNDIKYNYKSNCEQLAVFSEIYYQPGWDAFIDGKLSAHFRADYVLRAMLLPAGKHKIEFKFEPKAFFIGEKISVASLILFFILVVLAAAYTYKLRVAKRKDEQ